MSIDLSEYCTCEFGPILGDGRIDSNRCPIHDMSLAEQLYWGAIGWDEVEALEAERGQLRSELVAVLDVAIARGEKLGYMDDDYRQRLQELGVSPVCDCVPGNTDDCPIHGVAHSSAECAAAEDTTPLLDA